MASVARTAPPLASRTTGGGLSERATRGRRKRVYRGPAQASPRLWATKRDAPDGRDGDARAMGDWGERLKEFVTEKMVRAPTSFVVEHVIAPLYPETECGPGRYRDPGTDACVFMCREGYVWDAETKSCKLVVGNAAGRASVVNQHVPSVGRHSQMGKDSRPPEAPRALPDKLERRFYERNADDAGALDGVIRWCVNRLTGVSKEEECAVGFFFDKQAGRCTPICKPGYVYDPATKRCLKADEALHS